MQWKVIAALIGLLVIAVGAYVLLSATVVDAPQGFQGPVGVPYVEGPSGPPPNNN